MLVYQPGFPVKASRPPFASLLSCFALPSCAFVKGLWQQEPTAQIFGRTKSVALVCLLSLTAVVRQCLRWSWSYLLYWCGTRLLLTAKFVAGAAQAGKKPVYLDGRGLLLEEGRGSNSGKTYLTSWPPALNGAEGRAARKKPWQ